MVLSHQWGTAAASSAILRAIRSASARVGKVRSTVYSDSIAGSPSASSRMRSEAFVLISIADRVDWQG